MCLCHLSLHLNWSSQHYLTYLHACVLPFSTQGELAWREEMSKEAANVSSSYVDGHDSQHSKAIKRIVCHQRDRTENGRAALSVWTLASNKSSPHHAYIFLKKLPFTMQHRVKPQKCIMLAAPLMEDSKHPGACYPHPTQRVIIKVKPLSLSTFLEEVDFPPSFLLLACLVGMIMGH